MAKRKQLTVSQKVRKLRNGLGGRKAVVLMMDAASISSLKRWENRECQPIRAHHQKIGESYALWRRMGKVLANRIRRELSRR